MNMMAGLKNTSTPMGTERNNLAHHKSSSHVQKNQNNMNRYMDQKSNFNKYRESESIERNEKDLFIKRADVNFNNRPHHNMKESSVNTMKNRKISLMSGMKDVNVHIMDKDNVNVLRTFQCEKKPIIEGMQYFKKHLKDADQFNTIDI